jgi:hypothetical protein
MSKYFLKNKESGEIAAAKKKGGWTFFSFWRAVPDSGTRGAWHRAPK